MTDADLDRAAARARVNATLFGDVATVRFGRYHLLTRMGRGASGVVWSAWDEHLNRRVALKLLPPDVAAAEGSVGRARLQREARLLAQLRHENVVTVHDVGDIDGTFFIAMELISGAHLRAWLTQAPRTQAQIVDVLWQAARGIAAAHAQQLVHRDIKPENILIGDDGRVCVADFGLAQSLDTQSLASSSSSSTSTLLTASSTHGSRAGTLAYMAPEVLFDDVAAGVGSDQWSLAVTACEALTGKHPFPASTVDELLEKLKAKTPPTPLPSGAPKPAIERALSFDPAARFASVAAFADALRPKKRSRGVVVAVAAVATVVVAALATAGPAAEDCAASDELAAVWSGDVKAGVAQALKAAGQSDDAAAVVVDGFDRYRAAVKVAGTAICEERQQRRISADDHERRRVCLGRSAAAASSLLAKIKGADAATVGRAARALAVLPDPGVCDETQALQALVPVDPGARPAVDAILQDVQEAEQLRVLGKPKDAVARADAALARAADLDFPASRALALVSRGQALASLGEDPRALFEEAATLGLKSGLDDAAATALQALAYFRSDRDKEPDQAVLIAALGRALVDRLPAQQQRRQLAAYSNVDCVIALRSHQLERAEAACRETVRLREEAFGKNHPSVAGAKQNLAIVLGMRRDPRALDVLQETLAALTANFGATHPVALQMRVEMAWALMQAGQLDKAGLVLEAVRTDMVASGDEHEVPVVDEHLALLALARRDGPAALAAARRCLEGRTALEGKDAEITMSTYAFLADAERAVGHVDVARDLYARAYRWSIANVGEGKADGATDQLNQALQLVRDGKQKEARPIAEAVLAAAVANDEPDDQAVAEARRVVAQTLPKEEAARARELLLQARAYNVRFPYDAQDVEDIDAALKKLD